MRTTITLFLLFSLAGCTSTITREELAGMQSRTAQHESSGVLRQGNDLWYMGTKDGYDYYRYFARDGAIDTENDYRVVTANSGGEFPYTTNHYKWRKLFAEQVTGNTPEIIIVDGKTYKLVATTLPTTKDAKP